MAVLMLQHAWMQPLLLVTMRRFYVLLLRLSLLLLAAGGAAPGGTVAAGGVQRCGQQVTRMYRLCLDTTKLPGQPDVLGVRKGWCLDLPLDSAEARNVRGAQAVGNIV
jgi:hypothetical protein